jgi:hypothetical protein
MSPLAGPPRTCVRGATLTRRDWIHFRFQGHKNSRRQRTSTKDNFTLEEAEAALPSTDEEKYTHMHKNFGSDFWNFCQGLHHLLYMYEFFLPVLVIS